MKILVICQYYYPEPFAIPNICEELAKRGNKVTVVTGLPNYPMGEIYKEYKNNKRRNENINGIDIHRCWTVGRKNKAIFRFLNYFSFMFSSSLFVKKLKEKYDVVFVNQLSPVLMANAGIIYKKKHKIPLVLYCLDLWPESLLTGGVKKNSIIYNFFYKISKRIYNQVDKILITSNSFSDYFKEKFSINNTSYLPQYAENLFNVETCRKEKDEYIDLMFAGVVGKAQSVDTIVKAAKLTEDIKNLRWHIVGDGAEIDSLKEMAKDIKQVIFHGRKPFNEMPKYYSMADAMLITMMKEPIISMTLPGKMQTYLSAGKPIVGAIDGETKHVIKEANCGFCGEAENPQMLADNVRAFIASNFEILGNNARIYYENNFTKEKFLDKLEKTLNESVND